VRPMTVAQIRRHEDRDYAQIAFLESARFYKLMEENPDFASILERLESARATGSVVDVALASVDSDVIENVVS
jgi:hypothetical protein